MKENIKVLAFIVIALSAAIFAVAFAYDKLKLHQSPPERSQSNLEKAFFNTN